MPIYYESRLARIELDEHESRRSTLRSDCRAGVLRFNSASARWIASTARTARSAALTDERVIAMTAFRRLCPEQLLRPGEDVEIGRVAQRAPANAQDMS